MTTIIDSQTIDGFTVEVRPDENAESPREWCNLTVLVLAHDRYDLPNEVNLDFGAYNSWAEVREALVTEHGALHIFPVNMIDHSGLAFRMGSNFGDVDPGGWDSGQVGFVFTTTERLAEVGTSEEYIDECLKGEIEDYDTWSQGGCVYYRVLSPEGEVLEACGGYYDVDEALAEGCSIAEACVDERSDDANDRAAEAMADLLVLAGVTA